MSANPPTRKRLGLLVVVFIAAGALVLTDERAPEVVAAVARPPSPATGTAAPRPPPGAPAGAGPTTPASPGASGGLSERGVTGLGPAIDATMIMAINLRRSGRSAADPFAARSWNPPPLPAKSLPPSAPLPPPFAFTVLGKQFIDGRWEVFLGQRERTLIVREGDAIDGAFKVERIAPPTMTLEVLQFAARQPVHIGPSD